MIYCPYCRSPFQAPAGASAVRCPSCKSPVRLVDGEAQKPPPCARHADNPSFGPCERCGNFMCAICRTPWGDATYCPECVERQLSENADVVDRDRKDHRRSAMLSLVFGLIGWGVSAVLFTLFIARISDVGNDHGDRDAVFIGFLMIGCLQASGLGAIGVGHGAAAIRTRGDAMILATIGTTVSGLLLGVVVGLLTAILVVAS